MTKELEYLLGKVVVFDIDGTLMRYDFGSLGKGFLPDEWVERNVNGNIYGNIYLARCTPTHLFGEVIEKLGNDAWVLSVSLSDFESRNKVEVLSVHYPSIRREQILFCADKSLKLPILKSMMEAGKLGDDRKDVVLVEDDSSLVYDIKRRAEASGFLGTTWYIGERALSIALLSDFV